MRHLLLPLFLVALDIISVGIAAVASLYIRFDGSLPEQYLPMMILQLPILAVLTVGMLKLFHLYGRLWQYAGSGELAAGVLANTIAGGLWYGCTMLTGLMFPRGIYVISTLLLIVFTGASRMGLLVYLYLISKSSVRSRLVPKPCKNILIVGAGDAAALVAREIITERQDNRNIIGFVDDDESKQGMKMFGINVLGGRFDIPAIAAENDVREIIIAIPSAKGREIKEIINICRETDCKLSILPGVYDVIDGDMVRTSQLRPINIEDLLGRDPIKLDATAVSAYIKDKIVLVTGAGGSIGGEICRQIGRMQPKRILLLGRGENSIYEINNELSRMYPEIEKIPIIADVRDRKRICFILEKFQPQVVFHAAAHKHVPLMEYQPMEAVCNNIWGTKVMAEEAAAHKVETFVMISTDKAINPTSVMGCTKRVAEMFVQSMNGGRSSTRFVVVRFGNVLGSRGSVIPLFKKQIENGGPVTVTHPDMKRYFMTIPEASQLVLQAGAMAKGGEVFVLDMGEPVKIVDLAKDMIRLSGLEAGTDIEIKYTGLRPGEKLFEELLSSEDGTDATTHEKIFTARIKHIDKKAMDDIIERLLAQNTNDEVIKVLQEIVPNYHPNREAGGL